MTNRASSRSRLDHLAANTGALWTIDDVASALAIGTRTAWRLVQQGRLPPPDLRINKRICRWRPSTIQDFINSQSREKL